MRDICTESIVPIIPTKQDQILKFLLVGLLGVSFVVLFLIGIVGLIAAAVFAFLLYRHLPKTNGEYEYIHTNDVFDVDIVILNSRRRQLCSINLDCVSLIAPAASSEIRDLGDIKARDYSGNHAEKALYAMVYSEEGKLCKSLLRLDEEMLKSLKRWIPGRVKQ